MAAGRRWVILALTAGMAAAALPGQDEAPETPALVTSPMPFIGITPCRIADTRDGNRPPGYGPPALSPGSPRNYTIAGQCGIPSGAQAVSLNVTVVNPGGLGYVLLYPEGGNQPGVSTLNYLQATTVANAAIVPLGAGGGITVAAAVSTTDFIIDTNGYFGASAAGDFSSFLSGGNATMTGDENTGLGVEALLSNTTGSGNTAMGFHALLRNTAGIGNTAVGLEALPFNSSGYDNTALGDYSLYANSGNSNTAIGYNALAGNGGGWNNTAVGAPALDQLTFGVGNIALGSSTGQSLTGGSFNIYLSTLTMPASEDFTIRIGDSNSDRAHVGGIRGSSLLPDVLGVFVDVTGQLGTAFSSRRYKKDILDLDEANECLLALRPVSFRYRGSGGGRTHFGLIAEDVEALFPELVASDTEGRPESVRYQELPALLLEELKAQKSAIEAQDAETTALEERAERLRLRSREAARRLERLRARLEKLDSSREATTEVER